MLRARLEACLALLARLIAAVRVNRIDTLLRAEQRYLIKRRRLWAAPLIICGNLFLKASKSGIAMFPGARAWQRWELDNERLLYGEQGAMQPLGRRALLIAPFAGRGLERYLGDQAAWGPALSAAARELRRAHRLRSSIWPDGWSHGDLHLENVLFDPQTGAVRLIDFETPHERRLAACVRQADDLLVLLLDLLGRNRSTSWRDQALLFLTAYDQPTVLDCLGQRLAMPTGIARILWKIRTHGLADAMLQQRLRDLQEQTLLLAKPVYHDQQPDQSRISFSA